MLLRAAAKALLCGYIIAHIIVLTSGDGHVTELPYGGQGNNLKTPTLGTVPSHLSRQDAPAAYGDGISTPAGRGRPNPRSVSNALQLRNPIKNPGISPLHAYWGQLLVHETLSTFAHSPVEDVSIPVPACDSHLDPSCSGSAKISISRTVYDTSTGTSTSNPRLQLSFVTPYIDGSVIYGNTKEVTDKLRSFTGGELLVQNHTVAGIIPPFTTDPSLALRGGPSAGPGLLTGDLRSAMTPYVTIFHILFVREHNWRARQLAKDWPEWNDERLFQEARKWVVGFMQHITKTQYIPNLLGTKLPAYNYSDDIDPRIDTFFATCAYRYGHSAIPSIIPRLQADGRSHPDGHLNIGDVLLDTGPILQSGIDPILRGGIGFSEDVVDHLFGPEMRNELPLGRDILATNLQRGREVGLPSYNDARAAVGLARKTSFAELTSNVDLQFKLQSLYGSIDNLDAYVGGVIETPRKSALVGDLFYHVILRQFTRTMNGDRFWYEGTSMNYGSPTAGQDTSSTNTSPEYNAQTSPLLSETFGTLIQRHTGLKSVKDNPFHEQLYVESTVTSDERFRVQLTPTYTVTWALGSNTITLTLRSETTGWIAIGFGRRMVQVDLYPGWVAADGTVTVLDAWSDSFAPDTDENWGTASQVTGISGSEVDGVTTLTFTRPLGASDARDRAINRDGLTDCTFAWGTDDTLGYHGAKNRGSIRINFFTGESEVIESNLRVVHGVSLALGWCFLAPIGIWIARYQKTWDLWLDAHKIFQAVALSSILPLGLAATFTIGQGTASSHTVVGLIVLSLTVLQAILGNIVAGLLHTRYRKHTKIIKNGHIIIGTLLLVVAQVQVYLGLGRFGASDELYTFYYVYQGIMFLIFFLSELSLTIPQVRSLARSVGAVLTGGLVKANSKVDPDTLPIMPLEEFRLKVAQGQRYIVVDGYICDVEDWADSHPGGRLVLNKVIGLDATQAFYGEKPEISGHIHGLSAKRKLQRLRIAKLELIKPDLTTGLQGLRARKFGDEGPQEWTWERVKKEAKAGRELLVLDNYVADIASWVDKHPGGRQMFTDKWGRNVESEFSGIGIGGPHPHSKLAADIFSGLIVGRIPVDPSQRKLARGTTTLELLPRNATGLYTSNEYVDVTVSRLDVLCDDPGRRMVSLRVRVPPKSSLTSAHAGHHVNVRLPRSALSSSLPPLMMKAGGEAPIFQDDPAETSVTSVDSNDASIPPATATSTSDKDNGQGDPVDASDSRPYSILPTKDKLELQFYIREFPQGRFSPHLCRLPVGATLSMAGPIGQAIQASDRCLDVGFICAGTGIVPCIAYLRQLAIHGTPERPVALPRVHLMYSDATRLPSAIVSELTSLQRVVNLRVTYYITRPADSLDRSTMPPDTQYDHRIDRTALENHFVIVAPSVRVWLCGPPRFEDELLQILDDMGYSKRQVFTFN